MCGGVRSVGCVMREEDQAVSRCVRQGCVPMQSKAVRRLQRKIRDLRGDTTCDTLGGARCRGKPNESGERSILAPSFIVPCAP